VEVRAKKAPSVGVPIVVGMMAERRPAAGADELLGAVEDVADAVFAAVGFEGKPGQSAVVTTSGRTVVFVGLGDEVDAEGLRAAAGTARKAVDKADTVATTLHEVDVDGALSAVIEGFGLADYQYQSYLSEPDERAPLTLEVIGGPKGWKAVASDAGAVIDAVALARDLVNTPPRDKAPLDLAQRATDAASDTSLKVELWKVERLRKEKMGGILGVGLGSHRPPCLLRLTHSVRKPKAKLALVGKGITFDSGGLSIKPSNMMETMKSDMAGAAAVIGAMIAISNLGIPVQVTGYAALAENLPGGGAQRPGDVLTARNGKTIEVINTDAEGRLVLADALSLAAESEPDLILDLATLTGACKVALGEKIAGLWSNGEASTDMVSSAAAAAGERVWPMPQPADYWSLIESDIADMRNSSSSRYGSAMAATLLLEQFVGDVPWAHLDIAGPAFASKAEHYIPKGGTGFGVRTIVDLARAMSG
jgi:leucyl aminopeptidase